jgi:thioredoxin reductase (NADPH)
MSEMDDSPAAEPAGGGEGPAAGAVPFPELSEQQLARLRAYGSPEAVEVGDAVFSAGDPSYDLIVVESGAIEVVRAATRDAPEASLVRHGPGAFVGELSLLTGQTTSLTARVVEAGRVHRIPPPQFRRIMAEDAELSDLLLQAFLARRERLSHGPAARGLEIIGSGMDSAALALRTYAARRALPHVWLDADSVEGRSLMSAASLEATDLPAVLTPERTMVRTTPGELAEHLGLSYRQNAGTPSDLTIIGAGPAGLAAAVYGASEGLRTTVLDAVAPGGQAAASARIENYVGFPTGLSGAQLAQRAVVQAMKFGAQLSSPCEIVALETGGDRLAAVLGDGTHVASRAVIIATGARYRALPLEGWEDFVAAGISYAATEVEVRGCVGRPATVIGGANAAGQAALYLASSASSVTLAIRGPDIAAGMSRYLVDRIVADPRIEVRVSTEVTRLEGGRALERITLTDRATGEGETRPCHGLFCFIGAEPATAWLSGIALDVDGFIRTDVQLGPDELGGTWAALGRSPLPFETSVPAVFAAGDVRHGSMKRVAAAVGEGASAVRSVHTALGVLA